MEQKLQEHKDLSLFLDSGAHTLYTKFSIKNKDRNFDFYSSKDFWEYVDKYAEFLIENKHLLTAFVNVDVIFNPELSWEVQKYLETKYKLTPMPVIHYGTPLEWLKKYMKDYEYIGIGGLGQLVRQKEYTVWADNIFNTICDTPNRYPRVKTHGFAVTSVNLMIRYPWYSVDSTTWLKWGAFGNIPVPKYIQGRWRYDKTPLIISLSVSNQLESVHFNSLYLKEREIIETYIKEQGFTLGRSKIKKVETNYKLKNNERWVNTNKQEIEIIEERGLRNCYRIRREYGIRFLLNVEKNIATYPWAFRLKRKGFELLH